MPTTWEDVDRAVAEWRDLGTTNGPNGAAFRAVSALAELLAPPEGMDERIAEAVAAEAGWLVDRWSKHAGDIRFTVGVYREGEGWRGSWLYVRKDGENVNVHSMHFDGDTTGAEAMAAADAWLAKRVQS